MLDRTRRFALAIITFCEPLPKDETARTLGRQLLRSGTSVGANYPEAVTQAVAHLLQTAA